ncbi:sphingoid long chain base kinase 4 [Pseudovirgaria hyperparasitica]|uniref:Sphingoid long chain base kinase 4 n=1 Tax=Pseudovirgaria hyperparasitica TaxID=470096 RepID=A0A6A6WJQ2_9PEZI|nr:sphingoid long chain base kinase 4 [Pseudovirgaria hyperparasitica]KAF2761621.1 sphingoid long chain base kinase 4 [Pseudovirgaria hyperparasitica]
MSEIAETSNPFNDSDGLANATLPVGRNVSLTLGTDALVVLDEAFGDKQSWNCFGLLSSRNKTTRSIPFFNVLWAEATEFDITITYAHNVSKKTARPSNIHYLIEKTDHARAVAWVARLLDRAYGAAQKRKRIKVLVNPFGGQGGAEKYYLRDIEPILAAARCEIDVEKTQYGGHAVDLVEKLDIDQWDVIACCSGDGVPHEVFNGLAKKKNAARALHQVAVVQFPCGSGNAMSINLNGTNSPSLAAIAVVKGLRTPLDLISVTQDDKRILSFLSQSAGMVAECDLGTENLRWLGSARFDVGFLLRVLSGRVMYPADVAIALEDDSKTSIRETYRREHSRSPPASDSRIPPAVDSSLPPLEFGTVNDPLPSGWALIPYDTLSTFYVGNMTYMAPNAPFFPMALPTDGCADFITVPGTVPKLESLSIGIAVEKGTFVDKDYVAYKKIRAYRFIPRRIPHRKGEKENGYISIDGESVPFRPFQAEVHPGLGTVLSRSGHIYEKQR